MMIIFSTIILLSLLSSSLSNTSFPRSEKLPITDISRKLSYQAIAGYEPTSRVTDHAAIDLDMDIILQTLGTEFNDAFDIVAGIYSQGGNSKSYAKLTLNQPVTQVIEKGTNVQGGNGNNEVVLGKVLEKVNIGDSVLKFQYETSDNQKNYVKCRVGALPVENQDTRGCLKNSGDIQLGYTETYLNYLYNKSTDNLNKRTIKEFSSSAADKMQNCSGGCPYSDFEQFLTYYGRPDYGDHWVSSALSGTNTQFENGNANFGDPNLPFVSRAECAMKGMVYMNIYMYVIRELEDALDDCGSTCTLYNCNDDPVQAWDKGVAFYTGSLQGSNAGPGFGNLFYALADKRCKVFQTCGSNSDSTSGGSYVNQEIFQEFVVGQYNLLNGQCEEARKNKENIVKLMNIPLIQGTLRYAYKTGNLPADPQKSQDMSKEDAEGAVFAASILPKIHHCNPDDANIILDNMYLNSDVTDFTAVKEAFERNYGCLGVTCDTVGGLVFGDGYYPDAEPCSDRFVSKSKILTKASKSIIAAVAGVAGALIIVLGVCLMFMAKRERQGTPIFRRSGGMN